MQKKIYGLVLTSFLMSQITNFAQESFVHPDANVSVTLPAGWYYETEDVNMIAHSADKSVAMSFTILQSENLEDALKEVDDMLAEEYQSIELGETEEMEINGLSTIWLDGTADELEMAFLIIASPNEGVLMFVSAWGTTESIESYSDDIDLIFNSISPAN